MEILPLHCLDPPFYVLSSPTFFVRLFGRCATFLIVGRSAGFFLVQSRKTHIDHSLRSPRALSPHQKNEHLTGRISSTTSGIVAAWPERNKRHIPGKLRTEAAQGMVKAKGIHRLILQQVSNKKITLCFRFLTMKGEPTEPYIIQSTYVHS